MLGHFVPVANEGKPMKRFGKITGLISLLEAEESHGRWIVNDRHEGTLEDPFIAPYVEYGKAGDELFVMVHECVDNNEDLAVRNYREVLESYGLPDEKSMLAADVAGCDARCTLAMILYVVRRDRFCEGLLLRHLENGSMLKWMKRLEEIDGE